jgi:hypothetical protein
MLALHRLNGRLARGNDIGHEAALCVDTVQRGQVVAKDHDDCLAVTLPRPVHQILQAVVCFLHALSIGRESADAGVG